MRASHAPPCYAIGVNRIALALLLVAACAPPPPPPATPVASNTSPEPLYGGAKFKTAAAADPLAFLLADAEIVLSFDVEAIRRSFLWPVIAQYLHGDPAAGGAYDAFVAECGFDPTESLRRVTFGMRDVMDDDGSSITVATGISRSKLLGCMESATFLRAWKYTTANGITVATHARAKSSFVVTFLDETTSVWSLGKQHATPAALLAALSSGAPLRKLPAFAKVDVTAPIWGVLRATGGIAKLLSPGGPGMQIAHGSIRLDGGIAVNGRAVLDAPAQATATEAQQSVASVASYVDHITFTAEGNELVVDALMTQQQILALTKTYGSMFLPSP